MPVLISMLRGVNVGGNNLIKMDRLRALYGSLKLQDAQTYFQSGNVIFRTDETDSAAIGKKIQQSLQLKCGISCEIILRTANEMKQAIANNPFANRDGIEPAKLLVTFFAETPSDEAREKLVALKPDPEELHLVGRELYIYFPNGAGKSKLPWASLEKKLKFPPGTARNLNSVLKMFEMAEAISAIENEPASKSHRAKK
jgi:uncharacterized protein (DUF1697 family)